MPVLGSIQESMHGARDIVEVFQSPNIETKTPQSHVCIQE